MSYKIEDVISFSADGRWPQYFWKWKTTSIFQEMEDDLNFSGNKRHINSSGSWRQPLVFWKWKTTRVFRIWKTTKVFRKLKTTSISANVQYCQAQSRASFSLTELALFPLYYHQHPPTRNSFKLTWNENQTSQIGFNKLQMEDDLNFQKNGRRPPGKWKTTSTFFLVN